MASYVTPKRGVAFKMFIGLFDQSNTKLLKANPTLAAGDFKVSIDGGALNNLTTLPSASPASSRNIMVDLSASEMTGDNITVIGVDAAGAEWCDVLINIQTSARQIDDLAYPATSGRSMVVDASGLVDANMVKAGPTGAGTAQTARDIGGAVPAAAAGASGGLLISGSNSGTTTLGALTVTGTTTMSDGLVINRSSANVSAIVATGNGTGHGIEAQSGSGATGNGLHAQSNATNGHGHYGQGKGTGTGIRGLGGATGTGILGQGGATSGAGIFGAAQAGASNGITATGTTTGAGISATGGSTGHGLSLVGGATSGNGLNATHTGASNNDIVGNITANITGTIDTATAVTTVNGLAANVITATAINAGAITAAKFAAGAIDAAAIATDAIDADSLKADAVTEIANGIGSRQITEGYAVNGAAPTLDQALSMIWSGVGQFAVSSTTLTCYKLDGTTTSMTFTLDSATAPTSRIRAA